MRFTKLLHKQLSLSCPHIHANRLDSLMNAVSNLLNGRRLTLTDLGRAATSDVQIKNKIKQMERLLGNKNLNNEVDDIYQSLAQVLIGNNKNSIILVDWASVDTQDKFQVLKATLSFKGRGITIYDHIEYTDRPRSNTYNSHDEFINKLANILPKGCKPIIITDAGFHVKWFKRIEDKGWYWVSRLRGLIKMRAVTKLKWLLCKSMFLKQASTPKALGDYIISKKNPLRCSLYIYKKPKVGRIGMVAKRLHHLVMIMQDLQKNHGY